MSGASHHVGRRSGPTYETPVVAVQHDDTFLIALPYGKRTDWLKNVLAKGSATIVTNGRAYEVDRPQVIPMAEATTYFRAREQRMHRQFHSAGPRNQPVQMGPDLPLDMAVIAAASFDDES